MSTSSTGEKPIVPWPPNDLETVRACPVCGGIDSATLHDGLTDRVFGAAPGAWSLKRCGTCGSGYLDPRPTRASISKAYDGYYTHSTSDHPLVRPIGRVRSALHVALNGYQDARWGTRHERSAPLGRWLIPLIPPLRSAADAQCRHLPAAPAGGGLLLDLGCGNGGFLELARQAGWSVEGLDFDAAAVGAAQTRGLPARLGGIEMLDECHARYDVITLSHVIEHVHDPASLARRLFELLKPGGRLWLETPNLASLGANRYGPNWRGLEPPRHLVLFNRSSLTRLLASTGFRAIKQHWRGMTVFEVFAASEAIAHGQLGTTGSYQGRPPWRAVAAEIQEMLAPSKREFLTFTARKPSPTH